MTVVLYCQVCSAELESTIRNAAGQLVCQPRDLWVRVGSERYMDAMKEHQLVVPRKTPRGLDEPILPCGLTMRTVQSWR